MPARWVLVVPAILSLPASLLAQDRPSHPVPPGLSSGLPLVVPNDNRVPAGELVNGVRVVRLEIRMVEWRPEGPDQPGAVVAAFNEVGRAPSIPAPLLRVEQGTPLRVEVTNHLPDSTVRLLGLMTRPAPLDTMGLPLAPGSSHTFLFEPGAPGTYLYTALLGGLRDPSEQEQLVGGLVVDPPGGSPPDRVFVMNVYSHPVDTTVSPYGSMEALAINGLSWPHTERLHPTVGDTVRWRIVNGTIRNHPMHLHGFYFTVTAEGNFHEARNLPPEEQRSVVTEEVLRFGTFEMSWTPTRPGNWLFHCHLVFHVDPEARLPGGPPVGHDDHSRHMAGLVLGLEVQPGATTDLAPGGTPRELRMVVLEDLRDTAHVKRGYALHDGGAEPGLQAIHAPGPPLVLTRGEPTHVTVVNRLAKPTGVHWHGLELESWSDGVPFWSGTAGNTAPSIQPGDSFTARLTLKRPGTFIYHTHLNDLEQLTTGMYGAIIVIEPGTVRDPSRDHLWVVGWRGMDDIASVVVNGDSLQPVLRVQAGVPHRLRFINISPALRWPFELMRNGVRQQWVPLAKDGALVTAARQVPEPARTVLAVGETADWLWTPSEPGTYVLRMGTRVRYLTQEIEVVSGGR